MKPLFAFGVVCLLVPLTTYATVDAVPQQPLQGEAVLVRINTPSTQVTSVMFGKLLVPYFAFGTSTTALIGIGINANVGTSTVTVSFKNDAPESASFAILKRTKPTESLPVPAQMGGNSTSSQETLVSNLSKENAILANLTTNKKTLWSKSFIAPVAHPFITDSYGYGRDSGATTITHKGADFRAPIGTPAQAMNRGVVRLSRYSPIYGNTVVIDHGQGVMTMYMHLSKRKVQQGTLVQQGDIIGLSGDTGYSEGAHLHISVRINGESIDPIEFLSLFGVSIPSSQ